MSVEVSDIALPEKIILNGKYLVDEVHYLGHSGIVYFGTDIQNGNEVVIKEFMPYRIANRDMDGKTVICKSRGCAKQFVQSREAFDQECGYVSDLQDVKKPYEGCVVKYLDSFEEYGTRYLVTEKIHGRSLQDFLENGIDFDIRETMNMLVDIVIQIHKKGIIHCDLKPSNIVLTDDMRVVIIDFGSACYKTKGDRVQTEELMFASRGYSAPELYHGGKIDERTDIYSIGAILYYLFTDCQLPAPDEYDENESIPPISDFISIPSHLENAIMKMIERNEKKRLNSLLFLKLILNL